MLERPKFLPASWPDGTGWRLPVRPEQQAGPWGDYLELVAQAQLGNFSNSDQVVELVLHHEQELDYVAEFAGAVATHDQLKRLFPLIGTSQSFAVSQVAQWSHWLDFAEACIENGFAQEPTERSSRPRLSR